MAFSNSDNVHPSFIRATSEIKSLMGYSWDMTGNTPIWKFHAGPDLEDKIPYEEMSYDALFGALHRRHPDMDLTEWEKWREIEFGPNGEVLPRANLTDLENHLEFVVAEISMPKDEEDDSGEYIFPNIDGSNIGHLVYGPFVTDEQKRFLARLQKIGVEATFDDNAAAGTAGVTGFRCNFQQTPKENARPALVGRDFENDLIERNTFNDALLEETVRLFPNIQGLDLTNSHVTDEGLKILTKYPLPNLGFLSMGNTDPDNKDPMIITDKGMEAIGQFRFYALTILGCPITDVGVAHIKDVQRLSLPGSKITAKAFRSFAKMNSLRDLIVTYNDFSDPIDRETYEAIISLNGRLVHLVFRDSGDIHPSFIRATSEIESLRSYSWDMTSGTPIKGYDTGYTEISYEAILDALRRRHPDMDLTEWAKWREIEFGPNGEVLPRANLTDLENHTD